ncbi:MAG: hypothetical protein HYR85_12715 [Planctomycetes bacterium]|nr:hypothetical protein [Planctomycetota bacterium]MBI3846313.1 hypothetical protein [Planctomycetota bacterium]
MAVVSGCVRRWRRAVAPIVLIAPILLGAGCRSVQKEAGYFRVTASGFNILFFTIPPTNFEMVRDRVQREIGDTAQVTNIRRSGSLPPWWNVFNKILGIEIIEVYGTY